MTDEKDYILGTHDEEIARLGLQHRVWRPRALDSWRRAGFTAGQTILDIGCGPGYASLDLAEITGPDGMVHALDRSKRFLDTLAHMARHRGLANIDIHEVDLNESPIPDLQVDAAWARWVFAFVRQPKRLLSEIARVIRPGGAFVIHEYFDYSTWRLTPQSTEMEEFVRETMESWRSEGGEPDIGLELPHWLGDFGFAVQSVKPIIDIVSPANYVWQWPKTFLHVGLRRLAELGRISGKRAAEIQASFNERESDPQTLMVTPGLLEIIALRL